MFDNDNILENKFDVEYEEDKFVPYDFSQFQLDESQRVPPNPGAFNPNFQPPNFPGYNPNGNNIPSNSFPSNNFPNNNVPSNSFPSNNFPGGNINPSTLGAPPNHTPNKNAPGVFSFNQPNTKAVSQKSIRFCLFQFTYIWERNGRAYWAYLLNVDKVSVSGLRWFGRRWVFFGVDLRSIDSFICYRNNCENCLSHDLYRNSNEASFKNKKKLYTNTEVRESVSRTLVSLDIPEKQDDFIAKTIGVIDDYEIQGSIPCIKFRNTKYTINLEITYPENLDKNIKDKIIEYANEAANETDDIINSSRSDDDNLNPLETFNNYTKLISKALASFSSEFNSKLRCPEINKDVLRNVTYGITHCKITDDWKTKI